MYALACTLAEETRHRLVGKVRAGLTAEPTDHAEPASTFLALAQTQPASCLANKSLAHAITLSTHVVLLRCAHVAAAAHHCCALGAAQQQAQAEWLPAEQPGHLGAAAPHQRLCRLPEQARVQPGELPAHSAHTSMCVNCL